MVLSGNGQPQPPRVLRDNQHIFFSRVVKKYVFTRPPKRYLNVVWCKGYGKEEGAGGFILRRGDIEGLLGLGPRGHRRIVGSARK